MLPSAEDGQLYVANVGDSRLYLIGHEINQVTEDHSYVAAMMRAGELTEEQARIIREECDYQSHRCGLGSKGRFF